MRRPASLAGSRTSGITRHVHERFLRTWRRTAGTSSGDARECVRPFALQPTVSLVLWFVMLSAPPQIAGRSTAGVRPTLPAALANVERQRCAPRASAPCARHATAWRMDAPACAWYSSSAVPRSPCAECEPPRDAPSTSRWRSPASSTARRAFPRARDGSPRARTRPPASRVTFLLARPRVHARWSPVLALGAPPVGLVHAVSVRESFRERRHGGKFRPPSFWLFHRCLRAETMWPLARGTQSLLCL